MMTDYEHTLTVAINAISELIEDNRKLRATIEALRESKPSTAVSQSEIENIIYSVMATECQHDGVKFVKSVSERIFKLITGGN